MQEETGEFQIQRVIQELTETEQQHLVKLFRDPVFIKYLQNRILFLMMSATLTLDNPEHTDSAFRTIVNADKAYIRAYNELLSFIPSTT
jgi:hypothetical protein